MNELDFDGLDATEFEWFCVELLHELGFVDVDWRKGTGLDASPADAGRDIVAHWESSDADGTKHRQRWFVECKHYKKGVPPGELRSLLDWAEAERPHGALVIASNFLSNPAKEYLAKYGENNRPPFRIKYWGTTAAHPHDPGKARVPRALHGYRHADAGRDSGR